jgi:sulfate permease, SulP family
MDAYFQALPGLFSRPLRVLQRISRAQLPADLLAGSAVALVLLPQSLAFALLAGLPPDIGLISAVVAAVVGGLWGSSSHLHTGPTNTAAILTFSVLVPLAVPGSTDYLTAAALLALLAGLLRVLMGVARLGMLANFVSDSVAVGFTAGAGLLIVGNQLGPLLGIELPVTADPATFVAAIGRLHLPSLLLGLLTMALIWGLPRVSQRVPAVIPALLLTSLLAAILDLPAQGVALLGDLPQLHLTLLQLPPLTLLPDLAGGAFALALIGLVEALAIARAIATNSGERINANQELIGQGLANMASGALAGMPVSASFNRSALAWQSGGRSALVALVSGLLLIPALLLGGSLLSHLPLAVLAGSLMMTALSMVDWRAMRRIRRDSLAETLIMVTVLLTTLFLSLQAAVLFGVLLSLGYYLLRTATPRVEAVIPDAEFRHWDAAGPQPLCPQLLVVDLLGDLYFGAVNHIEQQLTGLIESYPRARFLLLRMHSVQQCDLSGIRMLELLRRILKRRGGELYFIRVRRSVLERMQSSGFFSEVGAERFLDEDTAIEQLFHHILDPAVCIYECDRRIFRECHSLPKQPLPGINLVLQPPTAAAARITAHDLWQQLRAARPPLVIDVREPREFQRGHIPQAVNIPLGRFAQAHPPPLPADRQLLFVCRSGSRSLRAVTLLATAAAARAAVLEGGMLAWEAANLLQAVPYSESA